jgi:phosphoglycerol transferase MdoB-like AlkP superfamily enzyme
VRGMEALTLSLPPTPGQAILYRPQSTGLVTLGSLFGERGYDCAFIYGGAGGFDYMNRFFGGNGYRVVDKPAWKKGEISFETSWGACDEDLYHKVLSEADLADAGGRPFHHFVMTTSNHRPFQFPDGEMRLKSDTGRHAAVLYADHAIGKFLDEARTHPWFERTLFVFCADHCASSAGRNELDVRRYRIPAIVWNPGLVPPREYAGLCSQIDLMPTVLGLMNWSYTTRFLGHDLLATGVPPPDRAFVSNYQKVALLGPRQLAILKPRREFSLYSVDLKSGSLTPAPEHGRWLDDAAAYYQTASWLFKSGGLKP